MRQFETLTDFRPRTVDLARPTKASFDRPSRLLANPGAKNPNPGAISPMDLSQVSELAISLMQEHGLLQKSWRFSYDFAKRRFGYCNYQKRAITISAELASRNGYEQVRDVILHEIAHALTPGAKHGPVWQTKAAEIGCKPERYYSRDEVTQPERTVIYTCPNCKREIKRFRRSARMDRSACYNCCHLHNNGKFHAEFRFVRS